MQEAKENGYVGESLLRKHLSKRKVNAKILARYAREVHSYLGDHKIMEIMNTAQH